MREKTELYLQMLHKKDRLPKSGIVGDRELPCQNGVAYVQIEPEPVGNMQRGTCLKGATIVKQQFGGPMCTGTLLDIDAKDLPKCLSQGVDCCWKPA